MNKKQKIIKNKDILVKISGSIIIKIISLFLNLLTVPIYMNFFEDKKILGVWFVIVSILNAILIFDFGIGSGLRNFLIEALIKRDNKKSKEVLSTSFILIIMISSVIGTLFLIGNEMLNWNSILNISENLVTLGTLIFIIRILIISVSIQIVFKTIVSILLAMEKVFLANSMPLISNFLILFSVNFLTKISLNIEERLIILSLIYAFSINVPLILTTVYVFNKKLKESSPTLRGFNKRKAITILKVGNMFFWIQLSLFIINLSNEYLIAKLFDPEDVVYYQIYNRIFMIFAAFYTVAITPIWSIITKLYVKRKYVEIKKIYLSLVSFSITCGVLMFGILPFLQSVIDVWLGDAKITIQFKILSLFATYTFIQILINSSACIANGIGEIKIQSIWNTIAAIIKIPLVLIGCRYIKNWDLIIRVNIIIMIPGLILQHYYINKKINKKIKFKGEE